MPFAFRKPEAPAAPAAAPAPPPAPAAKPAAAPEPSHPAAGPPAAAAPAAPDPRLDQLVRRVEELGAQVQGVAGGFDALKQETVAIAQRLKDGDEKFVRLLALLESAHAPDNPFVDHGPGEARLSAAVAGRGPLSPLPAQQPHHAPAASAAVAPSPPSVAPAGPPPAPSPVSAGPPAGELAALGPWLHGDVPPVAPVAASPPMVVPTHVPAPPPALPAPPPPVRARPPDAAPHEAVAGLRESVVLLEWADMLLGAVDRDALGHLLDWYEHIGWVDAPLKDRLIRCAEGILANGEEVQRATPANPAPRPRVVRIMGAWRQDLDLHYRSLAFVARLRGLDAQRMRVEEAVREAVAIRSA